MSNFHSETSEAQKHPPQSHTAQQWSDSRLRHIKVELSSANLLDLNGTPIEVIAAQGADTMIVLLNAYAFLDYGTGAYTAANDLILRYESAAHTIIFDKSFLEEAADKYESCSFNTEQSLLANTKIEAFSESNPTLATGVTGGTVTIHLFYIVNDL